jgi:outer membrane protein
MYAKEGLDITEDILEVINNKEKENNSKEEKAGATESTEK